MPWVIVGIVAGLVLLVGGGGAAAYLLLGEPPEPDLEGRPPAAQGREEAGDISGVQTFDDLRPDHTEDPVDYPEHPPVGGPHAPEWLNCGIYEDAVPVENAVHSLEHGAVWITHDPGLPSEELERVRDLYTFGDYLIISPETDLPAPIVATAWGKQLILGSAEDERLAEFLRAYVQGPQTREPGAPCSGMVGDPLA
ncbi:MAG: DUF3105 domain-containing protein [Nocardiopsaceae bacterium]|nr:DUF3105 domain-containing protein [Nocardiopsaceae bacterium]